MKSSETATVLALQSKAFNRLLCLPRVSRQLKSLETEGSFIAERNGEAKGCVGLHRLEPSGWFQIEHLATRDPRDVDLAKRLLGRELNYVRMKKPRYLKASTPSIQPYVDVYEEAGFEPVRRKLDISWDLEKLKPASGGRGAEIKRISNDLAADAASVWVRGLRPFWDWWIRESGGPKELMAWAAKSVKEGETWIGTFEGKKLVGVSLLRLDRYAKGWAWFNGIYVLPSHRGRGLGSELMNAVLHEAKRAKQSKLSIYTMAYLDSFAPGAVLYLKSGGKIETELLELQSMRFDSGRQ